MTETRLVRLPAGVSRVRFEGVADGIEPSSALITGLPGGVIEKNRDARLLSPSALVASAVGKPVELLRTNRKTGKTERLPGTILSDAEGGVVFKTAEGIEALRCSGLPETFSFEPVADLSARPTLSVEVQSPRAVTRAGDAVVSGPRFRLGRRLHGDPIPRRQAPGPRRLGDAGQFERRRISRQRMRRWSPAGSTARMARSSLIDIGRTHPGAMLAARLDQRSAA